MTHMGTEFVTRVSTTKSQPRERIGNIWNIVKELPYTGYWNYDVDLSQLHDSVLNKWSRYKKQASSSMTWVGHPRCPEEAIRDVKIRLNVRKGPTSTYIQAPPEMDSYRKTSYGRSNTTHRWELIEDFVPIGVTTHTGRE